MNEDRLWREIERLRDALHKARTDIVANGLLIVELTKRVDELQPVVLSMKEKDEIADGIAKKVSESKELQESSLRTWGIRFGIMGASLAGIGEITHLIQEWIS